MRGMLLVALLLVSPMVGATDYISFFGRALKQAHVSGVEPACPEDTICMDVFFRWTIRIDKLVHGRLEGRTVNAARIQHTEYIFADEHVALYVLSPIESEEKRKLLGADYWLEEYAPPETTYCFLRSTDYGFDPDDPIKQIPDARNCFSMPDDE